MKTYSQKHSELDHCWHLVDAEGQVLGRLASRVAQLIRGKHKATFVPHLDNGDFVVVTNAEKIRVTGNKEEQKTYFKHSGYPGAGKEISLKALRAKHPERIIQNAVKGMLPHNSLGRQQFKKMKVYAGTEHPHEAQQPKKLELG